MAYTALRNLPRRATLILVVLGLATCSSPDPELYLLTAVPGAAVTGTPRNVAVRAVSLARYLERSQIVRSSQAYRLDVLSNQWWGEPLDALINRVLVEELIARLPTSMVYPEGGAISTTPDEQVEINILRFDLNQSGAVLLQAQIAVSGRRAGAHDVSEMVVPADATTSALVAAMSIALGQLADVVAATLSEN